MIEAKLAGEGIAEEVEVRAESNEVDLMAALRKSLGEAPQAASAPAGKAPAQKKSRKAAEPDVRQQPGLKLPIAGGRKRTSESAPAPAELPASRAKKRA